MQESLLEHKRVLDLRIPYRSFDSPTAVDVMWQDGRNCYSNSRGYLERRPGFGAAVEPTPTAFGKIQRIFTWRRWPGTANEGYYIMVSSLEAGVACVYKLLVGTDNSAVKIWTSAKAEPFDFLEANNHCFFGNGTDMRKYDGETTAPYAGQNTTLWGIVKPAAAPGVTASGNTRSDTVTVFPLPILNGWSKNQHVGNYETGWGYNGEHTGPADDGTTMAYFNTANATDGNASTSAYSIVQHSHQYTGCVWAFSSPIPLNSMKLNITSEVPTNGELYPGPVSVIGANGSINPDTNRHVIVSTYDSGIWYSLDGGVSWAQVYWSGPRAKQTDTINLPATQDINKVQVMAFMDSHDDMCHFIYEVNITGVQTTDLAGIAFEYRYTYGNSRTQHESSSSDASKLTLGNTIGVVASTDPQVDKIHIYRTTRGGSTTPSKMQELPNSPVANSTATITDGQTLTLASPMLDTDTTAVVSAAATAAVPFVADIGNESILVTAVSGTPATTWTVQRAYLDTIAVAHASSSPVIIRTDDTLLLNSFCPGQYSNDPPTPSMGFIWAQNRVWSFSGNTLYYSGYEEIIKGVFEECFPSGVDGNYHPYKRNIHALAPMPNGISTLTSLTMFGTDGDSLDTFRWGTLLQSRGSTQRAGVISLGSVVLWFDTAKQVWQSGGFAQLEQQLGQYEWKMKDSGELGHDIRPDLELIDPTQCAMTMHIAGQFHWLIVQDGGNGKLWVLNLDTNHWQVPWTVYTTAIHSGETADGTVDLLVGLNGTRLCKLTPNTYTDNGAAYDAWVRSNLFDISGQKAGQSGAIDYVEIERNAVPITDALIATDESTHYSAAYRSIFRNEANPPLRKQGIEIVAKRYTAVGEPEAPACKRASFEFHWGVSSDKFELYTIDVAHHPGTSR